MPTNDNPLFPRILYALSGLAWILLLWPNPVTVFMAGCVACLTLPLYRRLRGRFRSMRRRIERKDPATRKSLAGFLGHRWTALKLGVLNVMPMTLYFAILFASVAAPIALFMVLVAPQVGSGIARLRELWNNNLQMPPEWSAYLDRLIEQFQSMPIVARLIDEGRTTLEDIAGYITSFSTESFTSLLNRGFNLLGGTMSVLWTFLLFFVLVVIFVIHAGRIHLTAARLFHMRPAVLHRFVRSMRAALGAVLMGVIFVAIIQGILCGIGFAVVGLSQFAFWGLLAALLAPIPMFGTALVWGPLCVHLWFTGHTMEAVGLALWGSIFVSTADSILRPFFLKQGIRASYLVLILVILCGIAAFGTVGLILGPVLLSFSIQALEEGNLAYPTANPDLSGYEGEDTPRPFPEHKR